MFSEAGIIYFYYSPLRTCPDIQPRDVRFRFHGTAICHHRFSKSFIFPGKWANGPRLYGEVNCIKNPSKAERGMRKYD